jgi:hypothetical protein
VACSALRQRREFGALGLAEFDPITYIHPCLLLIRGTDNQLNRMAGVSRTAKSFTPKQGQYLAFIHLYTRLHRRPPAETDMQQYFRVSPHSVHQMVLTLERAGFIRRQPRTARSIELLVDPQPARVYDYWATSARSRYSVARSTPKFGELVDIALGDLALDLVGNGGAVRLRRRAPTARSGPHWLNGAY